MFVLETRLPYSKGDVFIFSRGACRVACFPSPRTGERTWERVIVRFLKNISPGLTKSQGTASLEMPTCAHRIAKGGHLESQVDASWMQVKKAISCSALCACS